VRSEASIEQSCRRYAAKRGCWPIKIHCGVTGDPDRGFVLPGHLFWPVEFKRPGGPLRPRQRVRIAQLEAQGIHVSVIDDRALFCTLLDIYLEALVD
jgi:hypothetical protein